MTRRELEKILNASNIDRFAYDLNGGLPNEAYCMEEIGGSGTLTIQNEDNALP